MWIKIVQVLAGVNVSLIKPILSRPTAKPALIKVYHSFNFQPVPTLDISKISIEVDYGTQTL